MVLPFSPYAVAMTEAGKMSRIAFLEGDRNTEIEALTTIIQYSPWRGDIWLRIGRLQLDQGYYSESIQALDKAGNLGELSTESMLWLAEALILNGETDRARDVLRQFSSKSEVDPFIFLQAAQMQRSLNDTYGALATLLKAYEVDPLNGEVNYQTGLQLSATEPEQALPFLQRAAEQNSDRLGICETLIHMIENSSSEESESERFVVIGQTLSTYSEWDVAQRAFQKAVELDTQNGIAWALLAEAAQQNGEDGTQYILIARDLAPDAELVNGLTGLYYRRQGKSELAMQYLQRALEINPDALVWAIEIGNTYSEMGDLASALEQYKAATEIDESDWMPWRALAAFCVTRNYELEEVGLPAARQALRLNDQSPALMDLLGTALLMTNDYDEALYYFKQADAIDPYQSAILIHMGQLYLAMGDRDQGIEYLQQALDYARDNRLREMARRLLLENGADG